MEIMKQAKKFNEGEIAMLVDNGEIRFKVKILEAMQDEDGSWWYEVTPTDWTPIGIVNREVPQMKLESVSLSWYRAHIDMYLNSKYRRDREYGNYLKNYFEERDSNPNRGYGDPLPYNLYFC